LLTSAAALTALHWYFQKEYFRKVVHTVSVAFLPVSKQAVEYENFVSSTTQEFPDRFLPYVIGVELPFVGPFEQFPWLQGAN